VVEQRRVDARVRAMRRLVMVMMMMMLMMLHLVSFCISQTLLQTLDQVIHRVLHVQTVSTQSQRPPDKVGGHSHTGVKNVSERQISRGQNCYKTPEQQAQ